MIRAFVFDTATASANVAGAAALLAATQAIEKVCAFVAVLVVFFLWLLFILFFAFCAICVCLCLCDSPRSLLLPPRCPPPTSFSLSDGHQYFVSDSGEQMWNSSHIVLASLHRWRPTARPTPSPSPPLYLPLRLSTSASAPTLFAVCSWLSSLSSSIGRLSVHRSWVCFYFFLFFFSFFPRVFGFVLYLTHTHAYIAPSFRLICH